MISNRTQGVRHLVVLGQCVLVTAAFWLWLLLWERVPSNPKFFATYAIYNELILLGLLVRHARTAPRTALNPPAFEESSRQTLRQVGTPLFYLLLYLVASRDALISRFFLFSFIPLFYLALLLGNLVLPKFLGHLVFGRRLSEKILLVGPRSKVGDTLAWLNENPFLGLEVVGLLTDDKEIEPAATGGKALPCLGHPDDLPKVLAQPGVMMVILVEFPRNSLAVREYTRLCEERGIRLLVVADLDQVFGHAVTVFLDHGRFFVGLREEPLEDPMNRFFKRCLDIAVSLPVVLFILPPLSLLVWLAHRWQSPGPLFFRQPREGFRKESFNLFKYRSMHINMPTLIQAPTSSADPRLFPFGDFLRRSSLDEMPQFLNVLRGDMSVVGPRPHVTSDNQRFHGLYFKTYVRSYVKPGITGLAQVRGLRGQADTPESVRGRMEADIEYLENWSFALDCWLIIRTLIQVVVPPKTAR